MPPRIDLSGRRFGRLVAQAIDGKNTQGQLRWRCLCDCGDYVTVDSHALVGGDTHSCGCLRRDILRRIATRHGQTAGDRRSGTFNSWRAMVDRCTRQSHPWFANYGGRGISICFRWLTFAHFLADMGARPAGRTLDRIDPDGNYEPLNCRWATRQQQAANRRAKRMHV